MVFTNSSFDPGETAATEGVVERSRNSACASSIPVVRFTNRTIWPVTHASVRASGDQAGAAQCSTFRPFAPLASIIVTESGPVCTARVRASGESAAGLSEEASSALSFFSDPFQRYRFVCCASYAVKKTCASLPPNNRKIPLLKVTASFSSFVRGSNHHSSVLCSSPKGPDRNQIRLASGEQ